jgi:tetraacyldisaccharide 4'-kinase
LFNFFFEKLKNLEKKIIKISAIEYEPVLFSFEWLLVIISQIYKVGTKIRLWLYQSNILKPRRLPCFVISIGNIMAGGTGKTPMAIYITSLLTKMGKQPVVISRGYKGSLKAEAKIVGDGKTVFILADEAGDEPYMMAKRKSFPVVAGKDRYTAGMLAVEQLNPDVIILDDGFQHLKLKKDLNILLFDHDRPLGNKKMLPAGRLRETPAMSQNRTDVIVFTRCPEKVRTSQEINKSNYAKPVEIINQYPDIPHFKSFHTPSLFKLILSANKTECCPKKSNALNNLDALKGRNAVLFSGIANNTAFAVDVACRGCNIVEHLEFNDHFRYKTSDINMIKKRVDILKANMVVTTEKDWAKLESGIGPDIEWNVDMAVIGIDIKFENASEFESFLKSFFLKSMFSNQE